MDNHDTFPQFRRLPAEIRCLIWMFCLPRRIAEEDFPYTLLDGKECRQACWPNSTCYQNARVPLISAVCVEAREVAFRWGSHLITQNDTSMSAIWIQPELDPTLHLNYTRRRRLDYYSVYDASEPSWDSTPIGHFLFLAHDEYDMRASFAAELFYPFDLRKLMGSSLSHEDSEEPGTPVVILPENSGEERAEDLRVIIDTHRKPTIYATLLAISLHIDKEAAVESGLFGLLGDAPVQTVDFDDLPRLRRFHKLFSSSLAQEDTDKPHVDKLFGVIFSDEFRKAVHLWQERVRWLLQVAFWKDAMQRKDFGAFQGTDPLTVWTPPVSRDQFFLFMPPLPDKYARGYPHLASNQHLPDMNHFWWKDHAEKHIPKVVPQVMVRLCERRCYRMDSRPEKFGEASEGDFHPLHFGFKINERGWIVPKDTR